MLKFTRFFIISMTLLGLASCEAILGGKDDASSDTDAGASSSSQGTNSGSPDSDQQPGAPASFAIVSQLNETNSSSATISWQQSSGATSYQITVSAASDCSSPFSEYEVPGDQTSHTIQNLPLQTVYVCIVAINELGQSSAQNGSLKINHVSWWDLNYRYRQKIPIRPSANLAQDIPIRLVFDHANAVSEGRSLANGNDVRIAYYDGTTWIELNRILEIDSSWNNSRTEMWFKTQAQITGNTVNEDYYIYYDNPGASAVVEDYANMWLLYDDFEGGSFDTSKWTTVNPSSFATFTHEAGKLKIAGTNDGATQHTYWGVRSVQQFQDEYIVDTAVDLPNRSNYADYNLVIGHDHLFLRRNTEALSGAYFTTSWQVTGEANTSSSIDLDNHRFSGSLVEGDTFALHEDGFRFASRSSAGLAGVDHSIELGFGPKNISTFAAFFRWVRVRKWENSVPNYLEPSPLVEGRMEDSKWWNTDYNYRKPISITAGSNTMRQKYTLSFTFNHASLVSAGKSLANGDDIRVVFEKEGVSLELDRVLVSPTSWNSGATTIQFATVESIEADATKQEYFLYYGHSSASSPPQDESQTWLVYDDFSGTELNDVLWREQTLSDDASVTVSGGELNISGVPDGNAIHAVLGIKSQNSYPVGLRILSRFKINAVAGTMESTYVASLGHRLRIYSNSSTTKNISYWNGGGWVYGGSTNVQGSPTSYVEMEQIYFDSTCIHKENGVQLVEFTSGCNLGSSIRPDFGFVPKVSAQSFDVSMDDIRIQYYSASHSSISIDLAPEEGL